MEDKLYDTLYRYFNRLSSTGYIPDKDVFSVLVLTYITEVNKLPLTIEQQSIVNKALGCIKGSCLIHYGLPKGTCI